MIFFYFSGYRANKSCIFPFIAGGVTYYGCLGNFCPTKVDENGVPIARYEGYCGPDCPTQEESLKLSWRKDDTFKMTLQYKYDDQALWTGLELYGLLSSCFLLYSFILTAVISAIGKVVIRISYN